MLESNTIRKHNNAVSTNSRSPDEISGELLQQYGVDSSRSSAEILYDLLRVHDKMHSYYGFIFRIFVAALEALPNSRERDELILRAKNIDFITEFLLIPLVCVRAVLRLSSPRIMKAPRVSGRVAGVSS